MLGLDDNHIPDPGLEEKDVPRDGPVTPTPPPLSIRKKDFGFIPIPKNRRHDRNLKPEEQFAFTWRMNLVFAMAAVSPSFKVFEIAGEMPSLALPPLILHCVSPVESSQKTVTVSNLYYIQPMLVA